MSSMNIQSPPSVIDGLRSLFTVLVAPLRAFRELATTHFHMWPLVLLLIFATSFYFHINQLGNDPAGMRVSFGVGRSSTTAESSSISSENALIRLIGEAFGHGIFWLALSVFLSGVTALLGRRVAVGDLMRGAIWASTPLIVHNIVGGAWAQLTGTAARFSLAHLVASPRQPGTGTMGHDVAGYFLLKGVADGFGAFAIWQLALVAIMAIVCARLSAPKSALLIATTILFFAAAIVVPVLIMTSMMSNLGGMVTVNP